MYKDSLFVSEDIYKVNILNRNTIYLLQVDKVTSCYVTN